MTPADDDLPPTTSSRDDIFILRDGRFGYPGSSPGAHLPPAELTASFASLEAPTIDALEAHITSLWPAFFNALDLDWDASPTPSQAAVALRTLAKATLPLDAYRTELVSKGRVCRRLFLAIRATASEERALPDWAAEDLGTAGIAGVLWSAAVLGGANLFQLEVEGLLRDTDFQNGVTRRDGRVQRFTSSQLADILWALGVSRHASPALAALAAAAATKGVASFRPRQLTSLLWGFAVLNHAPHGLLRDLEEHLLERVGDDLIVSSSSPRWTTKQWATLLWALAVLGRAGSPLVGAVMRELSLHGQDLKNAGPHALHQLHQAWEARLRESGNNPDVTAEAAACSVRRTAQAAWLQHLVDARPIKSRYQEYLVSGLIRLGVVDFVEEDVSSGYQVDVALPELRLALEADGPTHRSRTTGSLLGSTVLKHRALEAQGWRVVSLSSDVMDTSEGTAGVSALLQAAIEEVNHTVRDPDRAAEGGARLKEE